MIERHFSSFYFKNVHSSDIVNADTDIIKYNSQYISLTLIYNFLELRFGWDRATRWAGKLMGKPRDAFVKRGIISVTLSSCVRLQQKYKM